MTVEKTTSGKLKSDATILAAVTREFNSGAKLTEVVKSLDKKTGEKTVNIVAPIFWRLEGQSKPFAASTIESKPRLRAAVLKARKSGERREVVAARAGISVAEVVKIEGKHPIWTKKGTKKHLATSVA